MKKDRFFAFVQASLGGIIAGISLGGLQAFFMPFSIALLWSASRIPLAGFCWGSIAVLLSYRWFFALHPLDWIGIPFYLSLIITTSIWLFCGLIAGLLVYAWSSVSNCFGLQKFKCIFAKDKISFVIFLTCLWAIVEELMSQGPLFWNGVGTSFLPGDRWIAGLARIIGGGGLTAIQLLIGWWIWQVFVSIRKKTFSKKLFFYGFFCLLIAHLIGFFLLIDHPVTSSEKVALWQTNIPIREKFSNKELDLLPFKLQRSLEQAKQLGASFLVAPEGTLPVNYLKVSKPSLKFLTGGFRWVEGSQRTSILVFDKGNETYSQALDKHRLVPLGEWIPPFPFLFRKGLSAVGGLSPGTSSRLLEWSGPSLAGAICYELSNGSSISKAVFNGAQWILTIANLDPYPITLQEQFLALAQLRSIETSRNLVSVANTGPTSLIRSSGKIIKVFPPYKEVVELIDLHLHNNKSLYVQWGNTPLFICLLISLFWCRYFSAEN